MRHLPALPWIIAKVEGDLRRRIERLWASFENVPFSNAHHGEIEMEFRALCRTLEQIAAIARSHHGHPHPPSELGPRIRWTVDDVVSALGSVDEETFGRRYPAHTAERSMAEPLWASVLSALQHVQVMVDLVRVIDPSIDEMMYEGLVQLQEPLRTDPIA